MIQITLSGDAQRALEQMPEQLTWALERAISRTAQEGAVFMKQELARQRLAATSLLINSVAAEAVEPLTWRFGPHVEHGWYVYQGRRPGGRMPPLAAIRDWVRVKRLGMIALPGPLPEKSSNAGFRPVITSRPPLPLPSNAYKR